MIDRLLDGVDGSVASIGGLGLVDVLLHGGDLVWTALVVVSQISPIVLPLGALSGRLAWIPSDLVQGAVVVVLAASTTVSAWRFIERRMSDR